MSLWLEDREDPLRHFHITIFDDDEAIEKAVASDGIARFVERLYPHIDRSTHEAPTCDVWLTAGHGVGSVEYEG